MAEEIPPSSHQAPPEETLIIRNGNFLFSASFNWNHPRDEFITLESRALVCGVPHRILGSCNGILCLKCPVFCLLWNPATKTHHHVLAMPNVNLTLNRKGWTHRVVSGLGYDATNDDYKLVKVYQFLDAQLNSAAILDSKVMIYSLRSRSWKVLSNFPHYVHTSTQNELNDVFVGGALHYIVSENPCPGRDFTSASNPLIAAFDVTTETYRLIRQCPLCPELSDKTFKIGLGVLENHLCVIRNYLDDTKIACGFWAMINYGYEEESWSMSPGLRGLGHAGYRVKRPITRFVKEEGGEKKEEIQLIQIEGNGLLALDLKTKSLSGVFVDGITGFQQICEYSERPVKLDLAD